MTITEVFNKEQFSIGDTSNYAKFIRNGKAISVKQTVKQEFKSLQEVLENPVYDQLITPIYEKSQEIERDLINLLFNTY